MKLFSQFPKGVLCKWTVSEKEINIEMHLWSESGDGIISGKVLFKSLKIGNKLIWDWFERESCKKINK